MVTEWKTLTTPSKNNFQKIKLKDKRAKIVFSLIFAKQIYQFYFHLNIIKIIKLTFVPQLGEIHSLGLHLISPLEKNPEYWLTEKRRQNFLQKCNQCYDSPLVRSLA